MYFHLSLNKIMVMCMLMTMVVIQDCLLLRYYSYALTGVEIEELVKAGPNMTADDSLRVFLHISH